MRSVMLETHRVFFIEYAISIPLHSSKNNFSCFQNNLASKKIFFF